MTDDEFHAEFRAWMEKHIGVSTSVLLARDTTDDWSYVIMMHAVLESALTHLLVTKLGNPKLFDIIPNLPTGDERCGKIAFIRAYGLLSDETCLFIRYFGEMRNKTAHNIRNFDFNIKDHLAACDKQKLVNWKGALLSWCTHPITDDLWATAMEHPRDAINNVCMAIIIECLRHQKTAETVKTLEEEAMKAIREHEESNPKE